MNIQTGRFSDCKNHHKGWFRVFRFGTKGIEIWFGTRYIGIYR